MAVDQSHDTGSVRPYNHFSVRDCAYAYLKAVQGTDAFFDDVLNVYKSITENASNARVDFGRAVSRRFETREVDTTEFSSKVVQVFTSHIGCFESLRGKPKAIEFDSEKRSFIEFALTGGDKFLDELLDDGNIGVAFVNLVDIIDDELSVDLHTDTSISDYAKSLGSTLCMITEAVLAVMMSSPTLNKDDTSRNFFLSYVRFCITKLVPFYKWYCRRKEIFFLRDHPETLSLRDDLVDSSSEYCMF